MTRPLRICLDARMAEGAFGGVEQFVIGLASGLAKLTDGDEQYFFLTYPGEDDWLLPYIGGLCQCLPAKPAQIPTSKKLSIGSKLWSRFGQLCGRPAIGIHHSDGTIERAAIDVMHFTFQTAFRTNVPSIYNPHDLQHVHLPKFFSPIERFSREVRYRTFCDQARLVAVASSWTKKDLVKHYGLAEDKIAVVPPAPATQAYRDPTAQDLLATQQKFVLPDAFVFYPAQTWEHKNHIRLIEALADLRDRRGLRVPFVSSGRKNHFYPTIERRVQQLQMEHQVKFLGYVSPLELKSLYSLARCIVIPTKFEAASLPLWEAFISGVPAACSNVTSLPEQAGDAALLFDPDNREQIATSVESVWTNDSLRRQLVVAGRENVARFSWQRTVELYRAHYRALVGHATAPDRELLQKPALL